MSMLTRMGVLLLAAASGGCKSGATEARAPQVPAGEVWLTPQEVKNANLSIVAVSAENVGGMIPASGRVTFDDLRVSHVFSPVTGRVVRILAQPGQRLKKGDALCAIVSPDVGSAFADLGKGQADLIAAEHEFKRQRELYQAHAGSQRDFETAEDNYGKAKAELERAQQKARLFRAGTVDRVTQEYTLKALIDGEVIARNVNPGQEVQGQYSGGTALELYTIGELDRVWVLADVFEMDLAKVKVGAPVMVKVVAYLNDTFEGKVQWVSGALDPASRTAKVRCSIANPERKLKPEMYATASIAIDQRRTLAVPKTAVLRLGEQTVVFVDSGQAPGGLLKFERRPVMVDEDEGSGFVPVTHGLEPGEKIVASGGILLVGRL